MAFPTTSFIPYPTIRDILKGATTAAPRIGAAATPDTLMCALYSDSATFDNTTDPMEFTQTGEVTGTNWATGGVDLGTIVVSLVASTGVKIDAPDVSVASTTLSTAIKGCLVYDAALSTAGTGLAVVYFGNATGYTTNNGTFGITWDSNGILQLTLNDSSA